MEEMSQEVSEEGSFFYGQHKFSEDTTLVYDSIVYYNLRKTSFLVALLFVVFSKFFWL